MSSVSRGPAQKPENWVTNRRVFLLELIEDSVCHSWQERPATCNDDVREERGAYVWFGVV